MTRGCRSLVFAGIAATLVAHVEAQDAASPSPPSPSPSPTASPRRSRQRVKVVPYGVVYFNGFNNSGGTNNEDVPLWAMAGTGDSLRHGPPVALRLPRERARRLRAPRRPRRSKPTSSAAFPRSAPARTSVRCGCESPPLDSTGRTPRFVLGQDWMVFAPVNPTSLACAAIPLFAAAGNPWARIPQVRLEERLGPVLLQAAALAPQSGDFSSSFLAQPNSGALSESPYLQARVAVTSKSLFGSGKPAAVGVSGHYGQSQVTPSGGSPKDLDSDGVALDWNLPLGKHVSLAGEAFFGTNLAGFQAGVFQGINPDAVGAAGTPESIGTSGGWAQIGLSASKLSLLAAFGIDDPDDDDLRSATSRNWRSRNQVVALAMSYRASAQLSLGIEYRFLETLFVQTGTQKDRHLNLAAVMAF